MVLWEVCCGRLPDFPILQALSSDGKLEEWDRTGVLSALCAPLPQLFDEEEVYPGCGWFFETHAYVRWMRCRQPFFNLRSPGWDVERGGCA